ncbi:MAG: hypothetical protein AB1757_26450 [Acidobacteriota bacterium]
MIDDLNRLGFFAVWRFGTEIEFALARHNLRQNRQIESITDSQYKNIF